jgi:hypothetical protein
MEIAGVPTVLLEYSDQINIVRTSALMAGCPNIRVVDVPRIGHAEECVATYYDRVAKALIDPLTAKEQEAGLYAPSEPPRVLFEGTSDEAQDFLQQTMLVENCRNCPICKYTDGLPVIIPTEEKVAEMLAGTSHSGDDAILSYSTMPPGGLMKNPQVAGEPYDFGQGRTATIEKAAICAVMAGCLPEYMPVVLAMAHSGQGYLGYYQTSSPQATWYVVSGPIAKEIGMNAGQEALDTGNRANMTLGRVSALMWVNFGGQTPGVGRSDSGNPIHSLCFAEDIEGNPPGWVGFNEECTYTDPDTEERVNFTAEQSVLGRGGSGFCSSPSISFPGYYRSLNQGEMGIARMMGVEGIPGYYNWLEPVLDRTWRGSAGGVCFVMHMSLAQILYDHGFKTKQDCYQWMYDTYTITVEDYYNTGLWEFMVAEMPMEWTSGKTWDELLATDPGFELHPFGRNCIIVSDSFQDEHWYMTGNPSGSGIDQWR